jgi:hypothetical protein
MMNSASPINHSYQSFQVSKISTKKVMHSSTDGSKDSRMLGIKWIAFLPTEGGVEGALAIGAMLEAVVKYSEIQIGNPCNTVKSS